MPGVSGSGAVDFANEPLIDMAGFVVAARSMAGFWRVVDRGLSLCSALLGTCEAVPKRGVIWFELVKPLAPNTGVAETDWVPNIAPLKFILVEVGLAEKIPFGALKVEGVDIVELKNPVECAAAAPPPKTVEEEKIEVVLNEPFGLFVDFGPGADFPPNVVLLAGIPNFETVAGAVDVKPLEGALLAVDPPKRDAPVEALGVCAANGESAPKARTLLPPSVVTRSRIFTLRYSMPNLWIS